MKEKKVVEGYSYCSSRRMDVLGEWFYGLFGWRYVETSSDQNHYVEKKTYLVSDGNNGYRVEDRYESSSAGYDLYHTFERETDDPKYAKYCELESRMNLLVKMWSYYPKSELEKVFPKGAPMGYAKYKKRFNKYYIYGIILLVVLAIGLMVVAIEPERFMSDEYDAFGPAGAAVIYFIMFGCPGIACIVRGVVGQIKSLNSIRMAEEYRTYIRTFFAGNPNPNMCNIIKEALELQIGK